MKKLLILLLVISVVATAAISCTDNELSGDGSPSETPGNVDNGGPNDLPETPNANGAETPNVNGAETPEEDQQETPSNTGGNSGIIDLPMDEF